MTEDTEEIVPFNLDVANVQRNNHMEMFFNWRNIIQVIHGTGSSDNAVFSIATFDGFNETGRILFTNNALQSFGTDSSQSAFYNVLRMKQLNRSTVENWNLFHSQEEDLEDDDDFIEWSLVGVDLIEKREDFRKQIDLYKIYDHEHHSITRLLIEIIDYYIKEYLPNEGKLSEKEIKNLERYFQQAIKEKNYLKYFIQAYTSSNTFHRVLNRHLALYILDYFDPHIYTLIPRGYRLINCLVYIVTLLINHPDIQKYQYKGIAYRGLLMTRNALERYSVGNHILNRSFVSATEDRSIAEIFSGCDRPHTIEQISTGCGLKQVSVLLKYTIKQNQTAIDITITKFSKTQDEEEKLILPFSVFQVKDRTESYPDGCSSVLVEITLEECESENLTNVEEKEGKP